MYLEKIQFLNIFSFNILSLIFFHKYVQYEIHIAFKVFTDL